MNLLQLFFASFNINHFIRFLEELKQHEHDQSWFIWRVQTISLHNPRRQLSWCPILSHQAVHCIQNSMLVRIFQVKHLDCLMKRVTNIIWRLQSPFPNIVIFCFRSCPLYIVKDVSRLRLNNQVETLSWFFFVIMQKFWIYWSKLWHCLSLLFYQKQLMFMKHFHLKFMMIFAFPLYFKPTMQVQV